MPRRPIDNSVGEAWATAENIPNLGPIPGESTSEYRARNRQFRELIECFPENRENILMGDVSTVYLNRLYTLEFNEVVNWLRAHGDGDWLNNTPATNLTEFVERRRLVEQSMQGGSVSRDSATSDREVEAPSSQFRAIVTGEQGESVRYGGKGSGVTVAVTGSNAGIRLEARHIPSESMDIIKIFATRGVSGGPGERFLGYVHSRGDFAINNGITTAEMATKPLEGVLVGLLKEVLTYGEAQWEKKDRWVTRLKPTIEATLRSCEGMDTNE